MNDITQYIRDELSSQGADLIGFGDITGLPTDIRCGMPVGICIAVKYPKEVIRGIDHMPTIAYHDQYNQMNEKLDMLVTFGANLIKDLGYEAIPQSRAYVNQFSTDYASMLPHKTVATRAGLGWIGKSALLVTKEYGSMIRISSILTNAACVTAAPINVSNCGDCDACTDACPANAISGRLWDVDVNRDSFFNVVACRKVARERAKKALGIEITLCGKCIEVCPYTKRYLNKDID